MYNPIFVTERQSLKNLSEVVAKRGKEMFFSLQNKIRTSLLFSRIDYKY